MKTRIPILIACIGTLILATGPVNAGATLQLQGGITVGGESKNSSRPEQSGSIKQRGRIGGIAVDPSDPSKSVSGTNTWGGPMILKNKGTKFKIPENESPRPSDR